MTPKEKILYHQIHPLKILTDVGSCVVSSYFLWIQNIAGFLITFLLPSVVATLLIIRFADLEKLKASKFGAYVARHMTRKMEFVRLSGQVVIWISSWEHQPLGITIGTMMILLGWTWGLFLKASANKN